MLIIRSFLLILVVTTELWSQRTANTNRAQDGIGLEDSPEKDLVVTTKLFSEENTNTNLEKDDLKSGPAQTNRPEKIKSSAQASSPVRTDFFVSTGVYYPFSDLEKSINKRWPNLLYKDDSYTNNDNDGVISYVYKSKPIRVFANQGSLVTRVPMRLKISYLARYPIDISFLFFEKKIIIDQNQEFVFDVEVDFRTRVVLDQSLKVAAATVYKVNWITYPYVELFGFFKFRVTKAVSKILNNILSGYSKRIDAAILSNFKIENSLKNISSALEGPILMDKDLGLWIRIATRSRLDISQVFFSPDRLASLRIQMQGKLKFVLDEDANRARALLEKTRRISFLPEMKNVPRDSFTANSSISISILQIQKFVSRQMSENQFVVGTGSRAMRISELYLDVVRGSGDQDQYQLATDVYLRRIEDPSAQNSMRLKIFFVPLLDQENGVLRMKNVDFQIVSENRLIKLVSVLDKDNLRNNLTKSVSLSIEEYLENMRKNLNKNFYQHQINPKISMRINLWSAEFKSISLSQEHVNIAFSVRGRVGFYLQNLF